LIGATLIAKYNFDSRVRGALKPHGRGHHPKPIIGTARAVFDWNPRLPALVAHWSLAGNFGHTELWRLK
jgi:hypothetical protein